MHKGEQKVLCCGSVSGAWENAFAKYCRMVPMEENCEAHLFIFELDAVGKCYLPAETARERGMQTVLWVTAGNEAYPDIVMHADTFSFLIFSSWSLFELCCKSGMIPMEKLHFLPEPVCFETANPFQQERKQHCIVPVSDTTDSRHQEIVKALACVYTECENGAMAVEEVPVCRGFDKRAIGRIFENRDLLLLGASDLALLLGALIGQAENKKAAISWARMLEESPALAARRRANAMREILRSFSPYAVWNCFLQIVGLPLVKADVAWIAACQSKAQIKQAIEDFNRQTWNQKRLLIVTDESIPVGDGIDLCTPDMLDKAVEAWKMDEKYISVWSPAHHYGTAYLEDLVYCAEYGQFAAVTKAACFRKTGNGVVHTEADVYQMDTAVDVRCGIVKTECLTENCMRLLAEGRMQLRGVSIDGFQFIENGAGYKDAAWYEDLDGEPYRKRVREIIAWRTDEINQGVQKEEESFELDAKTMDDVDSGTIYLEETGIRVEIDTGDKVIYAKPSEMKRSFQKPPSFSVCPLLAAGIRYRFSAELETVGDLSAVLMLVAYDRKRQIQQIKIESVKANREVEFIADKSWVSYALFLRMVGKGTVTCRNIRLKKLPVETVRLEMIEQGEMLNGMFSYTCTYDEGKHRYLRPRNFNGNRLAASPKATYFFAIKPGKKYKLTCRGWSSSAQNCNVFLLFYDEEQQVGRVATTIGKSTVFTVPGNTRYVVPALRMSGVGQVYIQTITIDEVQEQGSRDEAYYAVLTNHYPSADALYANMFVHARVKAYMEAGLNIRVFTIKRQRTGELREYTFENVHVWDGNADEIAGLLKKQKPRKVLMHFANKMHLNVIEKACQDVPKIVWCHGADVYPAYQRMCNTTNYRRLAAFCMAQIEQTSAIDQLLSSKNTIFVPVSERLKQDIEEAYGVEMTPERCRVIHNYIDCDRYVYKPKEAEQRFKIACVKSYSSAIYAGDLCAQVVHELAKRPCFDKLEFTFLGKGELFYPSLASLAKYKNVHCQRVFLDAEQLAQLYHANGILLMPTRHDTQGVSRDEAMACGMVPVSSRIAAVPEFVDETSGILAGPEDVKAMADAIEALVNDPERFMALSAGAAAQVRRLSGFKQTLQREIDLIEERPEEHV